MAIPANPTRYSAVYEFDRQNAGTMGQVRLRWTNGAGATSVQIQRWDDVSQLYSNLATVNPASVAQYVDTNLTAGRSYAYRFLSVNADGNPSNYTTGTPRVTIVNNPVPATDTAAMVHPGNEIDVTWNDHPSTLNPITHNYIFRRDNVAGGNGAQINRITDNGTTEFYRDSTAQVDRGYRYRTLPSNTAQLGAYYMGPWSNTVYTTPLAPTNVQSRWDGNNIRISWGLPSTIANAVEVEHSTDGAEWFPLATLGRVTTYQHSGPERGVSHRYRVRTLAPAPATGTRKASNFVSAPTIPAQLTPNAPRILGPSSAPPGSVELVVEHRPVDGSTMQAARSEYRVAGTTSWTQVQSLTLPLGGFSTGTSIEVRAYTRGDSATWSPPSAVHTITLRTKPAPPTITSPAAGTVDTSRVRVTITTPGTQREARFLLERDGVVISEQRVTTAKSHTFDVANTETYRIGAQWLDGHLWSDIAWRTITVALVGPPAPVLAAIVDHDTASVRLLVRDPDQLATFSHTGGGIWQVNGGTATHEGGGLWTVTRDGSGDITGIFRHVDDGIWNLFLEPVADVDVFRVESSGMRRVAVGDGVDRTPPLLTDVTYVARRYNEQGGWTDSEALTVQVENDSVIVNHGTGFAGLLLARFNLTLGLDANVEQELHQFAGRRFPVAFTGSAGSEKLQVSAALDPDDTPPREWLEILRPSSSGVPTPLWFRSPEGASWPAAISSVSISGSSDRVASLSFVAARVDDPAAP